MKGIAHFAVGVAAASCFPEVVRQGAAGNPLYFLLGGLCGMLPDTLDFKFHRFFVRYDVDISPDPLDPDPQVIACAIARAVDSVATSGRTVGVKLNTISHAQGVWQTYEVRFGVTSPSATRPDDAPACVRVTIGGYTGSTPGPAPGQGRTASVPLAVGLRIDYCARMVVDILDGPVFELGRCADKRVVPRFIPWHRSWTHSIPMAVGIGVAAGCLWGWLAGVVSALAYAGHALVDQCGFLGSCLWFPFSRTRVPGLRLVGSGGAEANLMTVWVSGVVVFWNLYRAGQAGYEPLDALTVGLYGVLLPCAALWVMRRWRQRA